MRELLVQFGVDWKLLIAQVVNFFLLLVILRIFAYKPILDMLRQRRKKIEEGLAASEESKRLLAETTEHEREILLKAEHEALALVSQAERDAHEQEIRILDAAHKKEEQVIASGQKKLGEEKLKIQEEIEQEAHELIRLATAKIVPKAKFDEALISEALQELKTATR